MEKNHYSQKEGLISSKLFGKALDEKEVFLFKIGNKNGAELSVMNYGATITSLKIPLSKSDKIDVVLGFNSVEEYINSFNLPSPPYFGTTVGRFSGRINNAQFPLNNKVIQLNKNHGEHNIHGGKIGFSQKIWKLIERNSVDDQSLSFQYVSKHNDEYFPGELTLTVIYTLTDNNELKIAYRATTTEDTLVNITHHTYFNLNGHGKTLENQKLYINSEKTLETTNELIPTGGYINLTSHDFNFLEPKSVPEKIDTTFVLNHNNGASAILISEMNNLKMSVFTNQPAVHVYVGGNCFNTIKGKENTNYNSYSGICFETQNFPDAPNHNHFPNSILRKNETYLSTTIFKFENLQI